jgi:flap endonuclease-1
MGVQITELLPRKEAKLEDFSRKVVAIDAPNHLYQFLTTIRAPDGSFLTDSNGNVTSHLIGLFSRTTHLLKLGIKPIYVFDGKVPELKRYEIQRRVELKAEANEKFRQAEIAGHEEDMKRFAARSTSLTKEMINDAKTVIEALGLPIVQAPGEGEAQAAHIVKTGNAYAVASQDADCIIFGATRLVRNLSIEGRRKKAGVLGYSHVNPEMIILEDVLSSLEISQEQLIWLAMLVGTDYNKGGIKGIGPKTAIKLVKKHTKPDWLFDEVGWGNFFEYPWQSVYELLAAPAVTDDYGLNFGSPDAAKLKKILCEEHNFAEQRVENALAEIEKISAGHKQKGLGDFMG